MLTRTVAEPLEEFVRTDGPRPTTPRLSARGSYRIAPYVAPRRLLRRLAALIEGRGWLRRLFVSAERGSKWALYGCRMCGQCALPATGYACPMTCPKQLRNGPCGGVGAGGECEVYPDRPCVWVTAARRAQATGHTADLDRLQRPIDHRLWDSSSWLGYWQGRDADLWTAPAPQRPQLVLLPVLSSPGQAHD